MSKYIAIAIGGALGSLTRFWVESTIGGRMGSRFPYGTLIVNVTACFIIGFWLSILNRRTNIHPLWRFLIPVGFIGAYSTFSTFEWETFASFETGGFLVGLLYVLLSVGLGFVAVWGGVVLANAVA